MKTLVLRLRTGFAALAMLLVFGNINAETLENSGTTLVFAGDGRKPASMGAGLSWESKATADVTAPGNYLTVNTNAINGDGWSNFSCIQVNNQTAVRANVYLVFQVRLATGKNADNLYIFPKDNAYPDQPANNSGSLKKLSDYTCNGAVLSTTADTWVVIPWTNSSTFFRMSFLDPDGALLLKDFYIATSNPTCISNLDKPVVTAVSAGCDRINLSWDAVDDALHYRILTVNGASGKDTTFVAQQTGTSYSHTGIRANTAYSYKILAISADGKSLSDAASATTAASDNPSPAISAAVPDYTSITLTLTPQPGAVSNMLYRGTSPADITTPTAYIGGTSFTDTGLDEGIAYYYRLVSTFASSCPTEATRKATTLLHVAYPPTLLDCSASACRQQLAGYINFAPKDGNETGRWDIDNIHYYGLANETLKTSATYRSTGKLTSDEYFIVKNPSTEYNTNNNGGADIPLQDIPNALGGVFVVRKGGDQTLRYTISGLESNQNYCVRIRMRNIGRPGADGSDISSPCNENGNNVRIEVVSTADGRSKSNGVYTTTNTGDCTTNSTQNGWGQQNAMRRYGDLTVFTGTVNTGNTDNFQLDIRGIGEYRNTMTGIETIEVYGCIPEPELTADKYTIDAGEEVTLKALKFACAESPAYLWSIVGGASLSETAQAIKVYPETTTTYRVECDGITRDTTITVRKNITSSSGLSFCEGKSSTLKANGIGLDSDTYIWTEKRGTYAAVTLPAQGREINITPSYIGTIVYTATNAKPGGETLTVTITVKDCCLDGTQFSISKVCNPLTVDGIANEPEWGVSPWVQVNKGSSGALSPNPAAQWKMLYDDDGFIYVFVRVYDDSNPANNYWNQPGNTGCSGVHCGYNGDAVEIYFDAGAGKCSGYPLQIGLMYPRRSADASPASPVTYTEANGNGKYNNQQCSGVSFAGYEATVIPWNATGKYWDVEFKFPAMANGVDLNQDSIRLEVGVNQSSNGSSRSAQGHTWTAAADMYANRNKLHWTQLGDCASARASKETVCDGGTTELSTRMRINTIGVDEETAYTWQVCATGCADNSVGNPAWQNISPELENTGNTITVSPNFGANTTLFYRAIYDDQQGGQVTTCPIAISKGTLTASASADPAVFCAGSGKISIEGDFDTHGGIMPNLQWGWKKATVNDIAVADWVSGYGLSGSEERKTLEISPIAASDGGFYFFVVSGDCEAASGGVAITVSDILEINKTVTSVCIDKTIDLTHANSGTTWISRTPAVATVTAGIVRGVSAGQVWIINKNAAGCADSVQITVSAIPVINKTVTQVCVGATINLTHANSGTSWISRNTGTATVAAGVVQGVAAGQVWILNENATGCADSVQVTVYALPTAVISGDTTICKGGNTANKVKITFTGKAPFKFTYSDGTTTSGEITTSVNPYTIASLSPVSSTIYKLVSLTDANGCTATGLSGSATITVNDKPTVPNIGSAPASVCEGAALSLTAPSPINWNGTATGTQGWEIELTPGNWTAFNPATAMVYATHNGKQLRYQATNSCDKSVSANEVTISVDQAITLNAGADQNKTCVCASATTTATMAATNNVGTGLWTKKAGTTAGTITATNSATTTITDLPPGEHSFVWTVTNGKCQKSDTVVIFVESDTKKPAFTLSKTTENANAANCVFTVPNLSSLITGVSDNCTATADLDTIQSPVAGTAITTDTPVSITLRDACGNDSILTATVTVPSALKIKDATVSNPQCATDKASVALTVTGGTPAYSYSFDDATYASPIPASIGNLNRDTTIYVKDVNGCVASENIDITMVAPITADLSSTPTTAHQSSDGEIIISNISGGYGATHEFEVRRADNDAVVQAYDAALTGLSAGEYKVYAKNPSVSPTCEYYIGQIEVEEPGAIIGNLSSTAVVCNSEENGSVTISNVSGGIAPYKYQLENNTGSVVVSYGNEIAAGRDTTFTGLAVGTYRVRVKDKNDIPALIAGSVTVTQPAPLTVDNTVVNPLCSTGSATATLTVGGGTAAYRYSLDSTFVVPTTWVNMASTTATLSGLTQDTLVWVKDANGCAKQTTVDITVPTAVIFSAVKDNDVSCYGLSNGKITVTAASGGTGTYQYSKDNGSTWQASNIFTGLTAASYNMLVKDANGCEAAKDTAITVAEPDDVTFDVTTTNAVCNLLNDAPSADKKQGSITVTVTSSTSGNSYEYSIDNGSNWSMTNYFDGLTPDTYYIKVKMNSSCETAAKDTAITQPNELKMANVPTQALCPTDDGSITLTVTQNSTPSYEYKLNTGAWTGFTSGGSVTLPIGVYSIQVRDANECLAAVITGNITSTDTEKPSFGTSCPTNSTVSADAGTCSFTINGTAYDAVATDNCAIEYLTHDLAGAPSNLTLDGAVITGSKTITWKAVDKTGNWEECQFTITVTDTEKPVISAKIPDTPAQDNGSCNYSIPDITSVVRSISSDNCTPQANLVITQIPVANTPITGNTTVSVTVKDAAGNDTTAIVNVIIPNVPDLDFPPVNPVCKNDAAITLVATNSANITGTFSGTGVSGVSFNPANANEGLNYITYTVEVGSCHYDSIIAIQVYGLPTAHVTATATCPGEPVSFTASGGSTYEWTVDGIAVSETGNTYTYNSTTVSGQQITASVYAVSAVAQGSCHSNNPATKTATVHTIPAVLGNLTHNYCVEEGTINITSLMSASNGGSLVWYASSGGGATITPQAVNKNETCITTFFVAAKSAGAGACLSPIEQVDVIINELPVIVEVNASNKGNSTIEIAGGTEPYTYVLDGGSGRLTGALLDLGYLSYGKHTVQIIDDNTCIADTSLQINEIELIPDKFFTPNGDGENDRWYITNIEFYPESQVIIHDRYGKELTSVTAADFVRNRGWDGTYLNKSMPATDYWYVINVHETGKRLTGHFLLKR